MNYKVMVLGLTLPVIAGIITSIYLQNLYIAASYLHQKLVTQKNGLLKKKEKLLYDLQQLEKSSELEGFEPLTLKQIYSLEESNAI